MKVNDLYKREIDDSDFRPLCEGNNKLEGEPRLLIAPIPGTDGYALRDSENPEAGTLRFQGEELRAAGIATD